MGRVVVEQLNTVEGRLCLGAIDLMPSYFNIKQTATVKVEIFKYIFFIECVKYNYMQ